MIMKRNGFKSASLFMYSDFQENMMNMEGVAADSAIQIVAMPLASDYQQYIYIDTVWLSSPILQKDLANEINVRIVNESEKDINGLPVNFEIEDKAVAFNTIDIPANSKNDIAMQFIINDDNHGLISGRDAIHRVSSYPATVSINDYPITFDDTYNFVLNVRPVIRIVELTSNDSDVKTRLIASLPASPIATLFENDSLFDYQVMNPYRIDQQYLSDCQMVIVDGDANLNETMWQSIIDCANDGGSVVVFPSERSENSVSGPKTVSQ